MYSFHSLPRFLGTCAGACADTCTADGRKYDSLAGVGGIRATCVNDNFMCTPDDPYGNMFSVLVHEFAHTVHQYALPFATDLEDRVGIRESHSEPGLRQNNCKQF